MKLRPLSLCLLAFLGLTVVSSTPVPPPEEIEQATEKAANFVQESVDTKPQGSSSQVDDLAEELAKLKPIKVKPVPQRLLKSDSPDSSPIFKF